VTQPAPSLPQVVPGQDILLQLGVAGVFLMTVIVAVVALWKQGKSERQEREAREKEREREAEAERTRTRAEYFTENQRARADMIAAVEKARADFLAESRRRDDKMESQLGRFEAKVEIVARDNREAVQTMQDKLDQSSLRLATLTDALIKRVTTER
jgi:hypothetical protein